MVENAGRKKRTVLTALAFLAMAIPPVVNSVGNPRLAGLRGPDALRLIAVFRIGAELNEPANTARFRRRQ